MTRSLVAAVIAMGVAAAGCGSGAPGNAERQDVAGDGYQRILTAVNGRYTTDGWSHFGPGGFDLDPETGVLTSHGGMGLLWYNVRQFGDFALRVEFRSSDRNANSGVFLRVPAAPSSDDYIYHSFEIQIYDAGEGIHQTGAVYDAQAPSELATNPPGEWNQLEITFVGNHITVDLNGKRVIDWDAEPRGKVADFAPRGYIGLQNHDDEHTSVSFRNVFVKDLTGGTP